MFEHCCPIIEQTGDGVSVGRCWFKLENSNCPRHGDVQKYVEAYKTTGRGTLENDMRRDKGMPILGG